MQTPNIPTGPMNTEPAQVTGYITAAVTAVIALLIAYGIDMSSEQQNAILGVVAVAAPVIAALVIRGKVYSPSTTQELVNDAAATGSTAIPAPPANNTTHSV